MGQKVNSNIFNLSLINSEYNSKYFSKNEIESTFILYKDIEIKHYIDRVFEIYGFIVQNIKIKYSPTKLKIFLKFYSQTNNTLLQNSSKINNSSSKNLITYIINEYILTGLSIYLQNLKIEIKVQNLNKKFKKQVLKKKKDIKSYKRKIRIFKRFTKKNYYNKEFIMNRDFIKAIIISLFEKNSSKIIAKIIAKNIERKKNRQLYIFFILKTVVNFCLKSSYSNIKGFKLVVNGRFNKRPRSRKFLLKLGQINLNSFTSNVSYYEETAYTKNGTFGIKVWTL